MLLPAWLWILVTIVALVISVIALLNGISARKRLWEASQKTGNLEMGMEQCRNALNQERERLEKIESEQARRTEAEDILNRISVLKQNVTDLESRKQRLEEEIKACVKLLHENREELKRVESESRQQEPLRLEITRLREQVAQEENKKDDTIKEVTELQGLVSSLNEEHARLESEIEEMQFNRDMEREVSRDEEAAESVIKRRIIRKHSVVT